MRRAVVLRRPPVVIRAIALLLGLTQPSLSLAQGIALAWDDCASSGSATRVHDCDGAALDRVLYASLMPASSIDEVVGAELVIDLQSAVTPVPSWWRLDPGGCRAGRMIAEAFPAANSCVDAWSDQGTALLQSVLVPRPGGMPSQARLVVAVALPGPAVAQLTGMTRYHLVRLRLRTDLSTGLGACAGCSSGACLVLNSVQLLRTSGVSPETPAFSTPEGGTGNRASWQTGADCAAVPARRVTWGQIRALYR